MHKLKLFIVSSLVIMLSNTICFASSTSYMWTTFDKSIETSSTMLDSSNIENDNTLNLESGSAILIEQSTGKVLYAHNIHEQLRPASVTKVMSLLLIMEQIDSGKLSLSDKIPVSENAAGMGGSQIWLNTTETLSVDDMLKSICVVSANDCVVAMAEYIAGSEEAFVNMMNEKAKELGMNDTTFKNCHGIDEDGHMTSAYDIALMSRELLVNHPSITNYTTIWMDSIRDGKSQLVNTNKLVRNYQGATGLKTGSTSLALYNLSASATRDDMSLIAVIMKAPTTKIRFSEAQKLLDYGFSNFTYKKLATKGDTVSTVEVQKGINNTIEAVFENDCGILIQKNQDKDVNQNVSLENNIVAPLTQGQKLGEVSYTINGTTVATVNIIAKSNLPKIGLISTSQKIYGKWFNLLRD